MTDDTRSATVLIVEDEQPLADLFAEFLKSAYTVRTAYDGTEALDLMSEEVDVVLLDRRMPGLTGEDVLEAIRAEGYDCRIAMVTAITPDIDIIEMGFDDYLMKPVERDDLLETVDHLRKLGAYDDLVEEYYRLASKKAVLEVEKPDVDLAEYEEFAQLMDRLSEIDRELQASHEMASEFDIRSLLNRPGTDSGDG